MALFQPAGGLALALKTSAAFVLVVLTETLVLAPRILGRMMELHPVMIIAILPIAQYFFGVWGLILATPVAVYVLQVLILGNKLPGMRPAPQSLEQKPPAPAKIVHAASPAALDQAIPAPHIKTTSAATTVRSRRSTILALVRPELGAEAFDLLHDVHAFDDLAEDDVLAVEPGRLDRAEEELRAVGVGSGVGHAEHAGAGVLEVKFSSANFSP